RLTAEAGHVLPRLLAGVALVVGDRDAAATTAVLLRPPARARLALNSGRIRGAELGTDGRAQLLTRQQLARGRLPGARRRRRSARRLARRCGRRRRGRTGCCRRTALFLLLAATGSQYRNCEHHQGGLHRATCVSRPATCDKVRRVSRTRAPCEIA